MKTKVDTCEIELPETYNATGLFKASIAVDAEPVTDFVANEFLVYTVGDYLRIVGTEDLRSISFMLLKKFQTGTRNFVNCINETVYSTYLDGALYTVSAGKLDLIYHSGNVIRGEFDLTLYRYEEPTIYIKDGVFDLVY